MQPALTELPFIWDNLHSRVEHCGILMWGHWVNALRLRLRSCIIAWLCSKMRCHLTMSGDYKAEMLLQMYELAGEPVFTAIQVAGHDEELTHWLTNLLRAVTMKLSQVSNYCQKAWPIWLDMQSRDMFIDLIDMLPQVHAGKIIPKIGVVMHDWKVLLLSSNNRDTVKYTTNTCYYTAWCPSLPSVSWSPVRRSQSPKGTMGSPQDSHAPPRGPWEVLRTPISHQGHHSPTVLPIPKSQG